METSTDQSDIDLSWDEDEDIEEAMRNIDMTGIDVLNTSNATSTGEGESFIVVNGDNGEIVMRKSNSDNENVSQHMRQCKNNAQPSQWKKTKRKMLRNSGQSYNSAKLQTPIPGKDMTLTPVCMCKSKNCNTLSLEYSLNLRKYYWNLADYSRQSDFIKKTM